MPANEVRVPQQERARRTRASLLEAARAEFSAHGYAKTTARSIAKQAGVATGSFYQYFGDKDATLRELLAARLLLVRERVQNIVEDLAAEDAADQLRDVVTMVVELHREDPGLHAVLTERRSHDPALDEQQREAERLVVDQVAKLIRLWNGGDDTRDFEAIAVVLVGMIEGSVHAHVLGHAMVDDKRFHAALVDALLRVAMPA